MQKEKLKTIRIPVKFALLIGLFFNLYFNVDAIGYQASSQELHNSDDLNLHERLSKLEAENQEHKTEISMLKTKSEEDKKNVALLTVKVDDSLNSLSKLGAENSILKNKVHEDRNVIEELTGRVAILEGAASTNLSETISQKPKVLGRLKRPYRLLPKQIPK